MADNFKGLSSRTDTSVGPDGKEIGFITDPQSLGRALTFNEYVNSSLAPMTAAVVRTPVEYTDPYGTGGTTINYDPAYIQSYKEYLGNYEGSKPMDIWGSNASEYDSVPSGGSGPDAYIGSNEGPVFQVVNPGSASAVAIAEPNQPQTTILKQYQYPLPTGKVIITV